MLPLQQAGSEQSKVLISILAGGVHKTWRKRYFILKDNCLYYFKNVGVSFLDCLAACWSQGLNLVEF